MVLISRLEGGVVIYIIFDLEATCDAKQNFVSETIEIGAVKFNDNIMIDEFQTFIRPIETPITNFCTALTGINKNTLVLAPLFPEAYKNFISWTCLENNQPLFCSWGFYDKKQIIYDCRRHNIQYKEILNHVSLKHELPKIYEKSKLPSRGIGMKRALNLLNIPFEGKHHRAIDDAKNISKIFLYYFDRWSFTKI